MDREEIKSRVVDFERFAPKLLKIAPKAGLARIPFRLSNAQAHLHRLLQEELKKFGQIRALLPKARRMGVSSYVGGRFYQICVTRKGTRAIVVAHRDDSSSKLFMDVKAFHSDVPENLRSQTSYSNAHELVFSQMGGLYKVSTAKGGAIGRGDTFQLMHLSEAGYFVNAADISTGLLNAVSDVDGTEIIVESTGNGQSGMFYSMCMEALRQNNEGPWRVHFLPWTLDLSYETRPDFIPQSWRVPPEFESYAQLHRLSRGQIHWFWRRNAEISSMNGGTADQIHRLTRQEFPIIVQESFLADSTFDFFPPSAVQAAMNARPVFTAGAPKILAVDAAGEGNDPCFLCDRQGSTLGARIWGELATTDQNTQADWIVDTARRHGYNAICVDSTGLGIGLVNALRLRLGTGSNTTIPIVAVNFGSGAVSKPMSYGNRKAEITDKFRQWLLVDGVSIPSDPKLSEELAQFKWSQGGCHRDEVGRLFVTKKEHIRKEIGRSTDRTDAAALTFAVDDSALYSRMEAESPRVTVVS